MKKDDIRLDQETKIWFYCIFSALFFSGILWLVIHYFYNGQIEFDSPSAAWQPMLMKIHGATAMGALVILGVLIPAHMQRGWKQRRNLFAASILIGLCVVMILSGYGLYYCGDDQLRSWVSGVHSAAGCLLPFILLWHIVSGRKSQK